MASDGRTQVVVVDDHSDTLEVVGRMLMDAGISCQTFLNGDAALSFINAGNIPRVVLSGYHDARAFRLRGLRNPEKNIYSP